MTRDEYIDYKRYEPNRKYDSDVFYARRSAADPFSPNVIIGSASSSQYQQAYYEGKLSFKDYMKYSRAEIPATDQEDLEYVRNWLDFKKQQGQRLIIPSGTIIRSTNPKYNIGKGMFPITAQKKVSMLHVNSGSESWEDNARKLVSATWVGLDRYFYNVEITNAVLAVNN
jgi:hypothetical protein